MDQDTLLKANKTLMNKRITLEEGTISIEYSPDFNKTLPIEKTDFVFGGENIEEAYSVEINFEAEVRDIVLRGLEENHSSHDITREIIGLRLSENKSFLDCVESGTRVIFECISKSLEDIDTAKYVDTLSKQVQFWKPFFTKVVISEEEHAVLFKCLEVTTQNFEILGG